jgi:cytochrome c-type biogenesis protein CcmH/NrfG
VQNDGKRNGLSDAGNTRDYTARATPVTSAPGGEGLAEAIGFFEQALAHDPGSVEARSLLAISLMSGVLDGMSFCARD